MSEWISVKERLPNYQERVLTVYGGVTQHMAYQRDSDGLWYPLSSDGDPAKDGDFTHWQPLPEPPEKP